MAFLESNYINNFIYYNQIGHCIRVHDAVMFIQDFDDPKPIQCKFDTIEFESKDYELITENDIIINNFIYDEIDEKHKFMLFDFDSGYNKWIEQQRELVTEDDWNF